MIANPTTMPGTIPAINIDATEISPATTANTIMILLGGITNPVVAAVVVTETLYSRPYPFLIISGIIIPPTLDTAAVAEPEMAPNIMQVSVLT